MKAIAIAALLLALVPTDMVVSGVRFQDSVTIAGTTLLLNGAGVRCVTILCVKVYVAGLYVRERTTNPNDVLRTDQPKYVVAILKPVGVGLKGAGVNRGG